MHIQPKRHIVDKNLEDWLREKETDDFPTTRTQTYPGMYFATKAVLKPIQEESTSGALLAELYKSFEEGKISEESFIYLTNHGPPHVKTVILRATQLLSEFNCEISAYEGYLLLMAIQFHDVAIITGRDNHSHATKLWEIMNDIGNVAGEDQPEKKYIIRIAEAHCGNINGNQDVISQLEKTTDLMDEKGIRVQFLAALLKFADELADDKTRASRYLSEKKRYLNLVKFIINIL